MRRGPWLAAAGIAAAAVLTVVLVVRALDDPTPPPDGCTIGSGPTGLLLSPEQAQSASTIAAVGRREGLPRDAVTVALATALRESKLFNLPYGDRDSLGLFQQRPSQGWGEPRQLVRPAYAAAAFYSHLTQVPHWQRLTVAQAAQEVQRSADGSAYALWEEEARVLTRVFTGRLPTLLACGWAQPVAVRPGALRRAAEHELGPGALTATGSDPAAAATSAAWLEAHGYAYGVETVTVAGRRWTRADRDWREAPGSTALSYTFTPAAALAMTGHVAALDDLAGAGVETLRGRS